MLCNVDRNRKFSERILSTPAIFKATAKLSAHKAVLMTKTDLIIPAFFQFKISKFRSSVLLSSYVFIPREAI